MINPEVLNAAYGSRTHAERCHARAPSSSGYMLPTSGCWIKRETQDTRQPRYHRCRRAPRQSIAEKTMGCDGGFDLCCKSAPVADLARQSESRGFESTDFTIIIHIRIQIWSACVEL